jgi:hypothetical protein
MKKRLVWWTPWLILLLLGTIACRSAYDPRQVRAAYLTPSDDIFSPATSFGRQDAVYCYVEISPGAAQQPFRAVWQATNATGLAPCTTIREDRIFTRAGSLRLVLPNDGLRPAGKYRLDLYVDGRLDRSLLFSVQ